MKLLKLSWFSILWFFTILSFVSCKEKTETNSINDQLSDSKINKIDSIIYENERLNMFVDILSASMDSIIEQENIVRISTKDYSSTDKRGRIKEDLRIFQEVMTRQREKLASLKDSLGKISSGNIEKIEKIISFYEAQIQNKEYTIAQLRNELSKKNVNISSLESQVNSLNSSVTELTEATQEQEEIMKVQDELLNEGYVIMGTKKELEKAGLLSSGGIFKKSKLNISNFREGLFKKVDIREFKEIEIPGKKPKILTSMPEASYNLKKNNNDRYTLYILDPTIFWSVSNYLIIQYN